MSTPIVQDNDLVEADRAVAMTRRLQAQGYPIPWQESRTHCPLSVLVQTAPMLISSEIVRRMTALANRLGEAMAEPLADLTREQIEAAKREAREHGHYPPAAYDDAGRLIPGAVEGHPWDAADRMCHRRLDMLDLHFQGMSNAQIAEAVGVSRRTVDRVSSVAHAKREDPAWRACALYAGRLHRRDDENATLLALALGLVEADQVPADHPAHERASTFPAYLRELALDDALDDAHDDAHELRAA